MYKINKLHHGKCFVRFYSLVEEDQKTHWFATLTRSFSDSPQLVNKNRTRSVLKLNQVGPFLPGGPFRVLLHIYGKVVNIYFKERKKAVE